MKKPHQAVVFDFDFTLVDLSVGTLQCIRYALTQMGLPPISDPAAKGTIGQTLYNAFRHIIPGASESQCKEFRRLFAQKADHVMLDGTFFYDDARSAIRYLKKKNIRMAIFSTKYRFRIEETLKREHLENMFDLVIGGEDVAQKKPDPEGLLKIIHEFSIPKESVFYAGDSVTDAQTAQAATVPFLATLSGVTPREAFSPFPAHAILTNLSEIDKIL